MSEAAANTVESRVPARMDRLPFARWHWLVIAALGITWILDGIEIGLASDIGDILRRGAHRQLSTPVGTPQRRPPARTISAGTCPSAPPR